MGCPGRRGIHHSLSGFTTEITEGKQAEDKLRYQHWLLEAIINGTRDILAIQYPVKEFQNKHPHVDHVSKPCLQKEYFQAIDKLLMMYKDKDGAN